jgi:hypothetical protein
MAESHDLFILWTNADPITAEKMVFMYAANSRIHGWWDRVTVIIWGATAKLVAEHAGVQQGIRDLFEADVHVSACKACADQLGATEALEGLGIEVKYWGEGLTEILKSEAKLLTV